jgi:hypothetical protein
VVAGLAVVDRVRDLRSRFIHFAVEPLYVENVGPGRVRFRPIPTVEVSRTGGALDGRWEDTVYAALDPGSSFEIVGGDATVARHGRASFDELLLRWRDSVPAIARPTRLRIRARGLDATAAVELPAPRPLALQIAGAHVNGEDVRPDSASGIRVVHVAAGDSLVGEVALRYTASSGQGETLILAYSPTWGDPSTSHRFVERLQAPAVNVPAAFGFALAAPATPGRYFLVFALGLETDAAFLFSGTNWVLGRPIWDDGNDIARWPAETILRVIRDGRAAHLKVFRVEDSTSRRIDRRPEVIGANALQVVVGEP